MAKFTEENMSIKNDRWIVEQAEKGMIAPFEPESIKTIDVNDIVVPALSFGVSSYGYDLRLSSVEFKVFRRVPGSIVNPKSFNPDCLEKVPLLRDEWGSYFVLPANSYGLGVSMETINMPPNVTAICLGKSTYARCGIATNITPIEAAFKGTITLEFSNSSSADCRIYANEGVVQLIFFEGEPCKTTYDDRHGKYQNQGNRVTLPRV